MLLQMQNITKEFPGVKALDDVTFELERGEFHALVGENGAGKSTLMKILSGVYTYGSYDGEIRINREQRSFQSIRDAELAGIAIIFQELSLVKELTVAENIFLGREPARFGVINKTKLHNDAVGILERLHLEIKPDIEVGNLGIGQQQLVEIAKALSQNAEILVLDEPTAALTESEIKTLFSILEKLKKEGVGMIYISHKLDEVFEMSDRITVLRDGKTVETGPASEFDKNAVIAAMVGREIDDVFPAARHEFGETVLEVRDLNSFDFEQIEKRVLTNISFSIRKGEVLGIAGLMGAGRSELLSAIFGAWQGRCDGQILVDGATVKIQSPRDAIGLGIGFVTEDRKRYGLIIDQSIMVNSTLAGLKRISGNFLTHHSREIAATQRVMETLKTKADSPLDTVDTLSGGNQQKVVIGKWLLTNPKILLLDEPTRGIDVGAKQEIYAEIDQLAKEGLAIVLVSSELPEILGLSDRVIVLHEGEITAELERNEATPKAVMEAATGNRRLITL